MTVYDVVKKLTGKIEPVGDSAIDAGRLENLEEHIKLVRELVRDLISVSSYETSGFASVKRSGQKAQEALGEILEELQQ